MTELLSSAKSKEYSGHQKSVPGFLLELYKYKETVIIRYNDIKLKQGCTGPIQIKKNQFTSKESVCGTLELYINSLKL